MDRQTLHYYSKNAHALAARYETAGTAMRCILRRGFLEGTRVLDIGAGTGRDIAIFLEMGCEAYGVEPCDELRAVALENQPELQGRILAGKLPDLGHPFGGGFDAVLCSAVLMHLPRAVILDAAMAIRNVLKENGRLLLSVPLERPSLDAENRDAQGRLFTPLPPGYLQLLFERIGFVLMERWVSADGLGRSDHTWCNFLFLARHPGGSRPLDQIEGILNRDRKTATYKLALFRALAEVATTQFGQARWLEDDIVGIPLLVVAEKWMHYYWPMFESATFIPQINGERPGCRMPVAFRASLTELVQYYQRSGGLSRFVLDYRARTLPEQAAVIVRKVLRQVCNTIVQGPVRYAGGSLEAGRVFQYDARSKEIRVSSSIWREFSLVGHWILDAVVLRWAELTSEIARRQMRPSEVVDLLLTVPLPERDVSDARLVYQKLDGLECTWTGTPLGGRFAVDHIIPFSLWHNNDLWNLVPVSPMVNSAKSDRLPTREIMIRRKDLLVEYWERVRGSYTTRFDHELSRLSGIQSISHHWPDLAFQCVADAVEFTAAQRGSERWQP